ncbi:MAG: hypothetical protein OEU26_23545 [Candidatus Tectomicrobia bacterium]|nr:hypothetical protein [Candidatus Tectomicrobia bacterium]
MRKVAAFLMALSLVIAMSGIAFAGGSDFCAHSKKITADKAETHKPVAQKSDSKTVTDKLLLAQKGQASKPAPKK